jgi:acid phosphatase
MGNCYLGQLTTAGHDQMRAVGIKLRERYVPQLLDLNHRWRYQIRASSTSSRRTAETTYQVVQGLVHGSTDTQNDVVVDVNVVEPNEETMYPRGTCARLRTQFRQLRADPRTAELKQEALKVLDEAGVNSEYWKTRILASMCNTFSSMIANKLPLPGNLTPDHVERICDISGKEYYNVYSRPHMARLGIGRFLDVIKHRMHQRIAFERHGIQEDYIGVAHAHPLPRVYLYGGHDNTLGPLLVSLGVFDMKHPPMGSYMAFELYKKRVSPAQEDTAPMYVKVHFNGKDLKLPGPCGNEELCSAHNFFKMIHPQIPAKYEEECHE